MLMGIFRRPLPPARQWAIAAGAQLARMHREPLDRLEVNYTGRKQRQALTPHWGIVSAEKAWNTLRWLATDGHNAQFLAKAPPDLRQRIPGGHIIAWDTDRLICVARWCFGAGYLKREQAWEWIMYGARRAQQCHASWAHYAAAYVAGYRYWANGPNDLDDEARNTSLWLTQSPDSPWQTLPWDLPLEE